MSTWHKKITQSLADSVSAVLKDMKEDQKTSQNKMLKKGKGEPISKPKQELPEEDKEDENGKNDDKKNGKKKAIKGKFASRVDSDDEEDEDEDDKKAIKGKFASRVDSDDEEDDGKSVGKKRKAISKAIRNTSAKGKKVGLTGKKEKVKVNPSVEEQFVEERAQLRETLEASFDTVFQYSNKEEESYREQWMNEFDGYVGEVDSNAYIDPLQRKVYYIEGITSRSAANRYLSHCIANAAMAGGEYVKSGTRGGDAVMSAKQQAQEVGTAGVRPMHQVKQ